MAFIDNGDGTITDDVANLMWEKKLPTAHYYGVAEADVQEANRTFSWSQPGTKIELPTGTAFKVFVDTLNGRRGRPALANHRDWRLPTRGELLSIFDRNRPSAPFINAIFQEAQSGCYWTIQHGPDERTRGYFKPPSMSDAFPFDAIVVNFGSRQSDAGKPDVQNKYTEAYVRAVRTFTPDFRRSIGSSSHPR